MRGRLRKGAGAVVARGLVSRPVDAFEHRLLVTKFAVSGTNKNGTSCLGMNHSPAEAGQRIGSS
jgi:hypothetical protein